MDKKNETNESILQGLQEALETAQGKRTDAKMTMRSVLIVPVKEYTAADIRRIRLSADMTQRVFAEFMGVSLKTVEAWERGTNKPSGCSSRLLMMLEMDKDLPLRYPFVQVRTKTL